MILAIESPEPRTAEALGFTNICNRPAVIDVERL
jgi:hypothetical protein